MAFVGRKTCRMLGKRSSYTLAIIASLAVVRVVYDVTQSDIVTSQRRGSATTTGDDDDEASFTCHLTLPDTDLRSARLQKQLTDAIQACPGVRRPESVKTAGPGWQTQQLEEDIVVLYSAFLDDRPAVGVLPWIRILGVAHLTPTPHFCHVWYPGCEAPYVTAAVVNATGRQSGYRINNVTYVQYLISCQLPGTQPTPSHVSVVPRRCSSPSMALVVEKPVRAEPDVDFGVCVAIAFGSVPTAEFVEWIELSRLLGVEEFNVYDAGMVNMTRVFDYYTNKGWLNVHRMPPPVLPLSADGKTFIDRKTLMNFSIDSVKLSSPASLNDCLLRNMYRYRFVVVIDFDEVIVPRLHDNYAEMLAHINRQKGLREPHHTYMFRNAFFFLSFLVDQSQPDYLRTMRYRYRTPPSPFAFAPKSFVDPLTCLSVFNHYCFFPLPKVPRPKLDVTIDPDSTLTPAPPPTPSSVVYIYDALDVSTDVALSHHYRWCEFTKVKCSGYTAQQREDNATLRFYDRLQPLVFNSLHDLQAT